MHLHVSPNSPALVRDAATAILITHISAGSIGLLSGATALLSRKGAGLHRTAGNVFFVSMLIMSTIGAGVAPFFPDRISTVVGVLTFYLVATEWATVKRRAVRLDPFNIGAFLIAAMAAMAFLVFGVQGMNSPDGMVDDLPYQPAFIFGAIALLAAASDFKVILGGVSGSGRIMRHLWRLCVALLIAASSLFQGQPQVFPAPLRHSPILFAPPFVILALMIFWLLRVRFTNGLKLPPPHPANPPTAFP